MLFSLSGAFGGGMEAAQLAAIEFTWEDIEIDGLDGKNFNKIRLKK